jgi:ATP-dependent protease ClpP protease subunit
MWQSRKRCRKSLALEEVEDEKEEKDDEHIDSVGNHIYFYSPVTRKSSFKFSMCFNKVQKSLLASSSVSELSKLKIFIHLHSEGGDVYSGLAIMDIILACPISTEIVVEGQCASAATLILLAGTYRKMTPNSLLLVHQISSSFWGTAQEWTDENKNMKTLSKKLKRIYIKYTNIDFAEIDNILKHDLYWPAKKCLKLRLIHEIGSTSLI